MGAKEPTHPTGPKPELVGIAEQRLRHPGVTHLLQFFAYDHLPEGRMQGVSSACAHLANIMANELPMNPETTAGLRKLLEAKDCFVRALVAKHNQQAVETKPTSTGQLGQ